MSKDKSGEYVTADDVAAKYRFSRDHIYRLARTGKIPAVKIGSRWRFSLRKIAEWLRRDDDDSEAKL